MVRLFDRRRDIEHGLISVVLHSDNVSFLSSRTSSSLASALLQAFYLFQQ